MKARTLAVCGLVVVLIFAVLTLRQRESPSDSADTVLKSAARATEAPHPVERSPSFTAADYATADQPKGMAVSSALSLLRPSPLDAFFSRSDQARLAWDEATAVELSRELVAFRTSYLSVVSEFVSLVVVQDTQRILELKVPDELRQEARRRLTEIVGGYSQGWEEGNREGAHLGALNWAEFLYPHGSDLTFVFVLDFDESSIAESSAVRIERRSRTGNRSALSGFRSVGVLPIDRFNERWGPLLGTVLNGPTKP